MLNVAYVPRKQADGRVFYWVYNLSAVVDHQLRSPFATDELLTDQKQLAETLVFGPFNVHKLHAKIEEMWPHFNQTISTACEELSRRGLQPKMIMFIDGEIQAQASEAQNHRCSNLHSLTKTEE